MKIVGVDIGNHGAVALLHGDKTPRVYSLTDALNECIELIRQFEPQFMLIEKALIHPTSGKKTWQTMGHLEGIWVGVARTLGCDYDFVYPISWQSYLGCRTKGGDKSIVENKMRKRFRNAVFGVAEADALAIALYAQEQYQLVDI